MKTCFGGMVCCVFAVLAFSGVSEASSSGVKTSKQLDKVAAQEANKMCKAYSEDAVEIRKGNCALDALVNAKDRSECEAMRKECLRIIEDEGGDTDECTEVDGSDFAGCAFTVGDLETCLSRLLDYGKGLSCDRFGHKLPAPPSCMEELQAKCGGAT
jgi:hypothetical protein